MAVEVALAMLQRDGHWLMQLRDEIPSIVAPGCWRLGCGRGEPGGNGPLPGAAVGGDCRAAEQLPGPQLASAAVLRRSGGNVGAVPGDGAGGVINGLV